MWQMILVHYGNRRHEEDRRPRCLIMKKLRHNRPLSKRILSPAAGLSWVHRCRRPAAWAGHNPAAGGWGRKRHATACDGRRAGRYKSFPYNELCAAIRRTSSTGPPIAVSLVRTSLSARFPRARRSAGWSVGDSGRAIDRWAVADSGRTGLAGRRMAVGRAAVARRPSQRLAAYSPWMGADGLLGCGKPCPAAHPSSDGRQFARTLLGIGCPDRLFGDAQEASPQAAIPLNWP